MLLTFHSCVKSFRYTALILALFIFLLALPSQLSTSQGERLTVERLASLPSLIGTAPSSPVWSPDSKYLAFLWNDKAMPFRDVWIVPAISGEAKQITNMTRDFPYPEKTPSDPYDVLAQKATARARSGASELIWTPDGKALVFSYRGDLFKVQADRTQLQQLTKTERSEYSIAFSPDGKYLSYLQEGDLWLWNQETNQLVQATQMAKFPLGTVPGSTYGGPEAEFVSYKWSPGSRHIALFFNDRTNVRKLLFLNYLTEEVTVQTLRRDYTPDKDSIWEIGIYSMEERALKMISLEGKTDRITSNYSWSLDGSQLLIDQNSGDAPCRWIYVVNSLDGSIHEIWRDNRGNQSYTSPWNSEWLSNGKGILFLSDLDGFVHLYLLPLDGSQPKQLTNGNWSIISYQGYTPASLTVSLKTREVYTVASKKNPYERQVYKMAERGGPFEQVTSLEGCHTPYVSPDGGKIALLHSNDVTPTELYIMDTRGKSSERRITHSPPEEFNNYKWIKPQYVTFKSHIDGATLHGRLLLPPNLDKSKKYPVILGPVYFDTVRNLWSGMNGTLQQYLALEGQYIGFHVDSRGSSGYGADFRYKFQYNCGVIDIEDLHSGVKYLTSLPFVDPERIGIWGSSYGGLLTVMSLFKKPGVYKAGVAGAPATNVCHAGTSESRLFGDPESHPEAYRQGSAFSFGEDLKDHLMIIQGMQDSTVLFRDSVALAEKLMMLGKDFDLVIAPSAVHGWSRKDYAAVYLLKKLVGHFDRYLGRGAR